MGKIGHRVIKRLLVLILIMITVFVIIMGGLFLPRIVQYYQYAKDVVNGSSAKDFQSGDTSYIYDSKGEVIVKINDGTDSAYISYAEIPQSVIDAFVSIEDRSFWENGGYDIKGIARVLVRYIRSRGDEVHGASTITQQLIKNTYLTSEVSLERKIKEILMAHFMTKKYSKEEIMEFYCNNVYFANGYYGINAAANGYFNKNAAELTLGEASYLSSIPNSPTYYNPLVHPEHTVERQKNILEAMTDMGYITAKEKEDALSEDIQLKSTKMKYNDYMASYAIDCAARWLMKQNRFKFRYVFRDMKSYRKYQKKYEKAYEEAKADLTRAGYHIYTSLDQSKQKKIQQIVNDNMSTISVSKTDGIYDMQSAVTVIDNASGKVICSIGGRTQKKLGYYTLNRSFQSYRQPGSSIKPLIVYAPAIDSGYTSDSVLTSVDVVAARNQYAVQMGGSKLSLEYSLQHSVNGSAWWLFTKIGCSRGLGYIAEMEFSHVCPDDYTAASALGGLSYGTNTEEMAGAYSTLANHGQYRETTCITKITDNSGKELYREKKPVQVYSVKAADTITDIMKGVLTSGTATGIHWYKDTKTEAACKTGTTNDNKDGWLCGYTADYTVSVWVGYDNLSSGRYISGIYMERYYDVSAGYKKAFQNKVRCIR